MANFKSATVDNLIQTLTKVSENGMGNAIVIDMYGMPIDFGFQKLEQDNHLQFLFVEAK